MQENEKSDRLPGRSQTETDSTCTHIDKILSFENDKSDDQEFDPLSALYKALETIEKQQAQIEILTKDLADLRSENLMAHDGLRMKIYGHICDSERVGSQAGSVTKQRCEEVKSLLRTNGGSMSFKDLRRRMGLKPNQFSRVIAALDKRSYKIAARPRSPKEKVLTIKVRWI